ncbi:MAG: YdcF family protein [Lentisphaeraceae bacterium]|nr:YdcF family protein [Lentisphaeraceae bacterium]
MAFYLKKFISLFIEPLNILFVLLGVGLYLLFKKEPNYAKGRKFILAGFVWLCLISWRPFSNLYIMVFESQYPTHLNKVEGKDYQYIAVLSSGHTDDETLPATEQQGAQSLYRLVEGVRLQKMYPNSKLVFSGYSYRGQKTNAEVSKEAAVILGADAERIIMLDNTRDTIEESIAIKKLVEDETILLVTSASHMPRAMALFKGQKINADAAPCQFEAKGNIRLNQTPSSDAIYQTSRAIYETAGYFWGWISGRY